MKKLKLLLSLKRQLIRLLVNIVPRFHDVLEAACQHVGRHSLYYGLFRQEIMSKIIHHATFFVGVLGKVVFYQRIGLLLLVEVAGVLHQFVRYSPVSVELRAGQIEEAILHREFGTLAGHEREAHAMGTDGAVGEGGCKLAHIWFGEMGGKGATAVMGRDVGQYPIIVMHIRVVEKFDDVA